MRHTLKIVLALACMALAGVAYADPPGRVARLNFVSGAVSFAPADAPGDWTHAAPNRPLTSGDRLWVDAGGRAELHVGSTALRLARETSMDVLNLDDDTMQVRLAQGSINLRVRDLARDEIVEIATPTGAVLIRQPGSYRVSVDPHADMARVAVFYGQAEIVTPAQTLTVPSSQAAVIPAHAAAAVSFEVVSHGSADDFDRWSAERDRREDQVTSTRYVSRDMTGYEDLDQYGSWRTLPEYGAVWVPSQVARGWAPYRHGHWVWMSPWGWTWVDDAPWGFAPSHYGRWVWVNDYWAWAPGPRVRRPVYAPALVAFVGGSDFAFSVRGGPAVGWFPLGWREPFIPWYRASHAHVRNVNVHHVTNVANINATNIAYVNRRRPEAVTVVAQQAFVSARPVAQARVSVQQSELARAEIVRERPPAEPVRASLAAERPGQRPPTQIAGREVVAVNPPARLAAREAFRERGTGFAAAGDGEPRVRVLRRERSEPTAAGDRDERPQRASAPNDRAAGDDDGRRRDGPRNRDAAPARPSASISGAPAPAAPAAPAATPPASRSPAAAAPPPAASPPAGAAPAASPAAATRPEAVPQPVPRAPVSATPAGPAGPGVGTPPSAAAERDRGDARRGPGARAEQRDSAGFGRDRAPERVQNPGPGEARVMPQPPSGAGTTPPPTVRAPEAAPPPREAPRARPGTPPAPQSERMSPRAQVPSEPRPAAHALPAQERNAPRVQAPLSPRIEPAAARNVPPRERHDVRERGKGSPRDGSRPGA